MYLNEFAKSKFGKEAVNNKTGVKETKIFFDGDNAAELYININDNKRWLEIREKDNGYREEVVKSLTKK